LGDARNTGGREQGRAARTESARAYYDEQWLEHMVRDLYHAVVDEPVPRGLLDIVGQIPEPSTNEPRYAPADGGLRRRAAKQPGLDPR
jgi:hypothetical protein